MHHHQRISPILEQSRVWPAIDITRILVYNERVNVQRPDRVTLTMPRDLVLTARAEAVRRNMSLSAVVRELLKKWLAGEVEVPAREGKSPEEA